MNPCAMLSLLCVLMPFTTLSAFASVPPDYIEPTRAEMKTLGFKFAIQRRGSSSSIELRFPKHVRAKGFSLVPDTTQIVVKNSAGEVIATTTNWVSDNEFMSVETSYNHEVSDVSVSVTYACERRRKNDCYGASTFSIPSISKFIVANPDAVNLRPRCRNVTSILIDCTKYESDEHP